MAINFNAQFIVNEKTATRVLKLTDTSTGFTLSKGNFSITYPDGSQVLHTDFITPDITSPGGYVSIALLTDANGAVLTGTYVINFVALDASLTEYNLQQTFDFNWVKPVKAITDESDVVIPTITFLDSTAYETSGSFTGVLTRNFYTTTPSTSEVGVITKTSAGDVLTPSNASKYYEGIYLVKSDISVAYTHSSRSWLTVLYTDLYQQTYDIREAPTQNELVTLMNEYKDQIEVYKSTNPDQYEILNEQYDLVVALYSHLEARYISNTLTGCKPILDQLLGLLPSTEPYTYKATQMLPFTFSTSAVNWGNILGTLSNQTDLQSALNGKFNNPTGTSVQYIDGTGALQTFPIDGSAGTLIRQVRNNTGATLTKGTVVYISGALGNKPIVAKGIATSDATSAQTFGLCQTDIANNTTGYVVCSGDLIGLDTSAYTEGAQLYLSSTVAGTYTTTKQYAPAHLVYIGVVTRSHPNQGQIEVKIQNGYELDELHNVVAQTPSNNDGIFYETSTSLWRSKSIASALGYTPYSASNPSGYISAITGANVTSALGYIPEGQLSFSSPLTRVGNTISLGVASSSANGYLSSTDWATFNLKQNALSGTGFVKSTAGVISYDTNTYLTGITSLQVTNALGFTPYNATNPNGYINLSSLSAGTGISYSNSTGVITSTISQYTDGFARNAITLTVEGSSGGATYNSATGVLNIPHYQDVLTNPLTGAGTVNFLGKYTGSTSIAPSLIYDNGTYVGINRTDASATLDINGTLNVEGTSVFRALAGTGARLAYVDSTGQVTPAIIGSGLSLVGNTLSATGTASGSIGGSGTIGYVPKFSGTAAITNSNIQDSGTLITLGSNTYISSGALGIGSSSLVGYGLRNNKNITGAIVSYAYQADGTIQSDVTSNAYMYRSLPSTQATTFSLAVLSHYQAAQGTFGAGSNVNQQVGFWVSSSLIGATTNFGFRGQIPAQTNAWNLYMDGTANNYLAGSLGIGTTSLTATSLAIVKNITGSTLGSGIANYGTIQSDVTNIYYGYYNGLYTQATAFTLNNYYHFSAQQATIGAGSTVINQVGFSVNASLIGGSSNYGFRGQIPSGANRWNIYMDGTANNYLAGDTTIGTTSLGTATKLTVGGSETAVSAIARGQLINPTLVASANNDVLVGLDINPTFTNGAFTGVQNIALRVGGKIYSSTTILDIGRNNTLGVLYSDNSETTLGNTSPTAVTQFRVNGINMGRFHTTTGNLTLQNGGTFTDAGYRLDVFGTTRFTGTTASDTAPLGAELAAVTGTGTNWTLAGTNLNVGGYTHTVGDVTPLTTALVAVSGTYYQIVYTITGRTAGSITINYGGAASVTSTTTGAYGPLALSTAVLTITPTTDFDGTVVLSIKSIGTSSASSVFANSAGTALIEMRATTAGANSIIGTSAGRRITTGSNNTLFGASAGSNLTTGINNIFIGVSAGAAQTTASSNTFIGYAAGDATTTGGSNVFLGINSGNNNTTGSLNVYIGVNAGNSNTTGSGNVAIGQSSLSSANVTGSTAVGHGALRDSTGINNTAFGYQTFLGLVAGGNNTSIGQNAGRYFGGGTTNALTQADTTTLLGSNASPLGDAQINQTVVGANAVGLGSNTTVLGNSSTTLTALYGAVITGGTSINASAQLQVDSTTKGFLPPRMTTTQRTAIATPAAGLIVFDTTTLKSYTYDGTTWNAHY